MSRRAKIAPVMREAASCLLPVLHVEIRQVGVGVLYVAGRNRQADQLMGRVERQRPEHGKGQT